MNSLSLGKNLLISDDSSSKHSKPSTGSPSEINWSSYYWPAEVGEHKIRSKSPSPYQPSVWSNRPRSASQSGPDGLSTFRRAFDAPSRYRPTARSGLAARSAPRRSWSPWKVERMRSRAGSHHSRPWRKWPQRSRAPRRGSRFARRLVGSAESRRHWKKGSKL